MFRAAPSERKRDSVTHGFTFTGVDSPSAMGLFVPFFFDIALRWLFFRFHRERASLRTVQRHVSRHVHSRLTCWRMADHHAEVVVKKAKLDPWKVNRGTKLSYAEYNRFMRIPFFTTNHLNLMFSWIVSFSIVGYTFFNMFLPWNIDGGKAYPTSCVSLLLRLFSIFFLTFSVQKTTGKQRRFYQREQSLQSWEMGSMEWGSQSSQRGEECGTQLNPYTISYIL